LKECRRFHNGGIFTKAGVDKLFKSGQLGMSLLTKHVGGDEEGDDEEGGGGEVGGGGGGMKEHGNGIGLSAVKARLRFHLEREKAETNIVEATEQVRSLRITKARVNTYVKMKYMKHYVYAKRMQCGGDRSDNTLICFGLCMINSLNKCHSL
jgi:hypothetical protein